MQRFGLDQRWGRSTVDIFYARAQQGLPVYEEEFHCQVFCGL